MNAALQALLGHPGLWVGDGRGVAPGQGILPTGLAALDALLPGRGWPLGAAVEIIVSRNGIGELRVLLPALAELSRGGRHIAWIDPPYDPYPPAFLASGVASFLFLVVAAASIRDRLWAAEQCLRSGACGAVLLWPEECDNQSLRRLQLAAEKGGGLGFLFRPERAAASPSPVALRLRLRPAPRGVAVEVLKGRGGAGRSAEIRLAG